MSVQKERLQRSATTGRRVLRAAACSLGAAVLIGAAGGPVAGAQPATPAASAGAYSTTETAAIIQLKNSYFSNIDAKNWAGLRELLAPDVVVDTTGSAGPLFVGRDPFIAFLQLTLGTAKTHHQGFDPQVQIHSANEAEATWRLEDVLIFGGVLGVHGYGNYQDKYEKVNGHWVESYSKLTRTRIDLINPQDGSVIEADVALERVVALVRAALGQ